MLPSPEILIRITQSIITAFSDSVSFESVKNKWSEIKHNMLNVNFNAGSLSV
jgi:hypothetical protein